MLRKSGLLCTAILVVAAMLLFSACKRDKVKLINKNFEDEVPTVGNLIFTFDKALAPDSILSYWDSTHYILFDPPIEGRFRWTTSSELVFSPLNELPASTAFKATLTPNLTKYSKFKLSGDKTFKFHTPYLAITEERAYWTANGDDYEHPLVQTDLVFNYNVNPKDVASHLKIKVEDKEVSFKLLMTEPSTTVSLQLLGVAKEDKDKKVQLHLSKGLTAYLGKGETKEDKDYTTTLNSPYRLDILSVSADHDGVEGHINVYTSQQVREADLDKFIKLSPTVTYKTAIEKDHFSISSEEFKTSQVYDLRILKGLIGVIGGKLKEDYSEQISFGELSPTIKITNEKGLFLSAKGQKNVAVQIVNVEKVTVTISKIYENNLISSMDRGYDPPSNGGSSSDEYDGEYEVDYSDYYSDATVGDVIWEKTYLTKDLPRNGAARLLKLDFTDKLPNYKGIYHIQISSEKDRYTRDSRFISISDIGLITKKGKDIVFVFANSIANATPMSGVEVSVIGRNNQLIGKANTDGDGMAAIKMVNADISGFTPLLVTAKAGNDYTYLPLKKTQVNTSRFDVGGRDDNPAGMDCFLYPERNLYRPGETVHFSGIIRTLSWEKSADLPIKVKISLPDGKEFKTYRKTLNEQGSFEGAFDVSTSASTGTYSVEVFTSNDVLIGDMNIKVEEFMPDRIKVTAVPNKKELGPNETLTLGINATNYFGPPAADNDWQAEFNLSKEYFSSKDFPDYSFSQQNENTYFSPSTQEGKTDEKGNAVATFAIPAEYQNMGKLSLSTFVTVFDENGRAVNKKVTVPVYTQDVFFGIGSFDWWNSTNTAIDIPLAAADKYGKGISGVKARVQVIKYDYKTVLEGSGSYYSYRSERLSRVLSTSDMTLSGGSTHFKFVPKESGEYELRVFKQGVNTYVSRSFYAYGYGSSYNSSFQVDNEGNVDVIPDKESYAVGDNAKILFKTPFAGKLLVTVERNEVMEHYIIETDKKSASLNLKITDKLRPNVFISATLIKPHAATDLPLTVAHGYAPLKVQNPSDKIDVGISAAKSSRSQTKQKISVHAAPGAYVSIAAVDEGILALGNFSTPDPYGFFYAMRGLNVKSYDMYPYLFEELVRASGATGGDEGGGEKRVNPMTNKRVKLVSFWSGLIKCDGSGNASYEINIPQFSGQLRIMAVAHRDHQFGSKDQAMTIADPIVVSTGLPRFLSPGDTVELPVSMSNTLSKSTTAKASVSVTGPLRVVGANSQSVSIKANGEGTANFKVYALPQIGIGQVNVAVNAGGESFGENTAISIRPSSPLQKRNGYGVILGGASQNINIAGTDFIPSSLSGKLVLSKSPMVQFTNHLDNLVQYPYGCVEQTVSAAFPQLYYGDICIALFGAKNKKLDPAFNIEEALRKIKLCQIYNGGVTMWSSGGEETWWGACYAAHFMIEAKKAGYEIEEKVLEKLCGYLIMKLKGRETVTYYYNRTENKKIAPKEVAYSLYVLALAGKPQSGTMSYYKTYKEQLALDSKYLLSAAFYISGDRSQYKDILPGSFSGEESVSQFDGSFYSATRDRAIALNSLLDIDPKNPQIGILSKHLTEDIKNDPYLSTQEEAFTFLALGKLSRDANKSNITADIVSGGKSISSFKDGFLVVKNSSMTANTATVKTAGSGRLYYFWEAEGISSTGAYKEEDSYLQVRRAFFDRFGHPISGNTFKQNDLVVVRLSIRSDGTQVNNVVLSDIIPAGFEIENPNISDVPGTSWVKDASYPTHMDIRDDRINLFVSVNDGNPDYYYYVVRCVTKGNFKMGPVGADAMYNGEYHSYNGGGSIKIIAK